MRLDEFLTDHRAAIIERSRSKVAARRVRGATDGELEHGSRLFLDQLIDSLRKHIAMSADADVAATRRGRDLLEDGLTVAQVVHD